MPFGAKPLARDVKTRSVTVQKVCKTKELGETTTHVENA